MTPGKDSVRSHLRGSSLLMSGRFLSMGLNLCVQVLVVRYLVRADYGAFAYALALGELGASFSVLGLDKSLARFAAVDEDRGQRARVLGALLCALLIVLGGGALLALGVHLGRERLPALFEVDEQAIDLLRVLVVLAPLMAADALLTALYGVLSKPRAIFFRRYVLGPGLKLLAVLGTMAWGGSALMLAGTYVAAVALGLCFYLSLLSQLVTEAWRSPARPRIELPSRAFLTFGVFVLLSDLVFLFHNGLVVFALEYFQSAQDVAGFRAIQP